MKPQEESVPQEAPTIAALPSPSPEELLREQLAESERQLAESRQENITLTKSLAHASGQATQFRERLEEIEKNPFTFAMANIDAGHVLAEAGEKMNHLTALVQERGNSGEVVVKLKVKPCKGDAFEFNADLAIKEPKVEPFRAIFYPSPDGGLQRQDPRQRELPLR